MRRLAALAVAALLGLSAAGCGGGDEPPEASAEFCEAAEAIDDEFGPDQPIEEQVELVTDLDAAAPDEISEETGIFLDALERRAEGDESVVDDPEIEAAVDDVNRYANEACDLLGGSSPFG